MTNTARRPREDSWNVIQQNEDEVAAARMKAAEQLAGGPLPDKASRRPTLQGYPAFTPQRLLSKSRDKATGRLLDPEPEFPTDETDEQHDRRRRRNLEAWRADRDEFMPPPGCSLRCLFTQRWSQLVVDLNYPPRPEDALFTIYINQDEAFPWLLVPGSDKGEAEQRYIQVCGINVNPLKNFFMPPLVVEQYESSAAAA